MPTSIRNRSSQSIAISHPSLLPSFSLGDQREQESFASASTATLPPRYRITLALPPRTDPLSLEESHAQYVRGEEFLSDGWRRAEEGEGVLDKRKEEISRNRAEVRPLMPAQEVITEPAKPRQEVGPLWLTTSFKIACLCMSDSFSPL